MKIRKSGKAVENFRITGIASGIVLVIILVAAFGRQGTGTSSLVLSNASYRTSIQISPGASVLNQKVGADWMGAQDVVTRATYIIEGTILGIVNATVNVSGGNYIVQTYYVMAVNDSLMVPNGKALSLGRDLIVVQDGGIAEVSPNHYINQSYANDGYPSLRAGTLYVLAMDQYPGKNALLVLGPSAVFWVGNHSQIYSWNFVNLGGWSDWSFNGVSMSQFMQSWKAAQAAIASSTAVTLHTSSRGVPGGNLTRISTITRSTESATSATTTSVSSSVVAQSTNSRGTNSTK